LDLASWSSSLGRYGLMEEQQKIADIVVTRQRMSCKGVLLMRLMNRR